MIIATDMPEVARCTVSKCAYNTDDSCHARAITIGDGDNPGCDTYFANSTHTRSKRSAGVGACKVDSCDFNDDFECSANGIQVGRQGDSVKCMTCSCH
ncbi:DUF1540 domain-containing protein [Microbulbifer marinus]|uniref:DUF1540 domain-containing protein n=1 Tax=Microbulbifer marinus TaxID=658218 RepID=A0A1H3XBQ2_9GAMM|nr:DUF1540 domain-containing protein [Microbulbifer marinus]SDZ96042.1 protein of unknown function [Microbulbifer marinus]